MFNSTTGRGRDTATPGQPAASGQAGAKRGMFSVIGQDVVLTGNIAASADLHVDGRIEGDVQCSTLVQGTESRIAGNVAAETARLAGTIEGTVSVRQLTVERTARITGDVEYESLSMENGATIDGHLRHRSRGALKLEDATKATPAEPLLIVSEQAG